MIVIKNYLSTSQVPPPQLMLIKNLAYITKRKPLDHTDGNLLSNLKTVPSTDLLKVRMAACGQIQTLSSQDTAISDWESFCGFYHRKSSYHPKPGRLAEVCSTSVSGLAALHQLTYTSLYSNQSQLTPGRGSPQLKTTTIIKLH